ncbi:hypothetical protein MKEN_00749100 [Mycena kentingensis (nom. inval.)]|nr:hypothetical protein MKEN_00749100 [Mycena kentingensis (nom. inval.)]
MHSDRLNTALLVACVAAGLIGAFSGVIALIGIDGVKLAERLPADLVVKGTAGAVTAICAVVALALYGVLEVRKGMRVGDTGATRQLEGGSFKDEKRVDSAFPAPAAPNTLPPFPPPLADQLLPPWATTYVPPAHAPASPAPLEYRCIDCPAVFTASYLLCEHMEDCHGWEQYPVKHVPAPAPLPFTCVDCFMGFFTAEVLRTHMEGTHGWRQSAMSGWGAASSTQNHACAEDTCTMSFGNKFSLRSHLQSWHGWATPLPMPASPYPLLNFYCTEPGCFQSFSSAFALGNHVRVAHPYKMHCTEPGCYQYFGSSYALDSHVRFAHPYKLNTAFPPTAGWANTPTPNPYIPSAPAPAPWSAAPPPSQIPGTSSFGVPGPAAIPIPNNGIPIRTVSPQSPRVLSAPLQSAPGPYYSPCVTPTPAATNRMPPAPAYPSAFSHSCSFFPCGLTFETKAELDEHIALAHLTPPPMVMPGPRPMTNVTVPRLGWYFCSLAPCFGGRNFETLADLDQHVYDVHSFKPATLSGNMPPHPPVPALVPVIDECDEDFYDYAAEAEEAAWAA